MHLPARDPRGSARLPEPGGSPQRHRARGAAWEAAAGCHVPEAIEGGWKCTRCGLAIRPQHVAECGLSGSTAPQGCQKKRLRLPPGQGARCSCGRPRWRQAQPWGCQSQLSAAAGAPARLRFAKRPNSPGFGSFALEACDSGLHGCGSWGLPVGGAERQSQLHAGALQGTSRSSWEPQSAGCGAVEPPARGAPERPPASAEGAAVPAGALEDGEPAARRRRVKGARVWVPGNRPPRAKPGLEPSSSSKEFQDHE